MVRILYISQWQVSGARLRPDCFRALKEGVHVSLASDRSSRVEHGICGDRRKDGPICRDRLCMVVQTFSSTAWITHTCFL